MWRVHDGFTYVLGIRNGQNPGLSSDRLIRVLLWLLCDSLSVVIPFRWQLKAPGRFKRLQEAEVEALTFLRT